MPRLDAIGLVTTHMGDAIDFYQQLGLVFDLGGPNEGHSEATTPGGIRVMLDTEEMVKSFSDWVAPTGSHRAALAFLCASPDEVDRLHLALTASRRGRSHVAPFDAPWGQRYATVLDPDGNAVDLFAPMP
jgi:catechol 2,3-dioxygenase-like lactoylglutathione lyase family enzyme